MTTMNYTLTELANSSSMAVMAVASVTSIFTHPRSTTTTTTTSSSSASIPVTSSTSLTTMDLVDYDIDGGRITPEQEYNWPVLFFFVIVFLAIGGNVLVCLAVKYERKLHNMFNFFLVSLALSDMLSAILVMPLSIVKAFIVNLPIPKLMCVTWYSLDVLFTSSTIIHLCMISVDRYMTLQYPLRYGGHTKRTKDTVLKIIVVWILSFCISGPLFIFSMFDKQDRVYFKGCGPETPTFVISATVSSFFLPLLIMAVMYILTVRALHRQRKDTQRMAITVTSAGYRSGGGGTKKLSPYPSPQLYRSKTEATIEQPSTGTLDRYSSITEHYTLSRSSTPPSSQPATLLRCQHPTASEQSADTSPSPPNGHANNDYVLVGNTDPFSSSCNEIALDDISQGALLNNTQTSGGVSIGKGTTINGKQRGGSTNSNKRTKPMRYKFRSNHSHHNHSSHHGSSSLSGSRKGMNALDKGRKAVQVLGILFAVFVLFYFPFFATYLLNGTCEACQPHISPQMLTAFEWLAYTGSMVNPIVYHIFNADFQRAFHKLLRCKCHELAR